QYLHHDRRGERDRVAVVPHLPAVRHAGGDRLGLGAVGAAVPLGRPHRLRIHQRLQGEPRRSEGRPMNQHSTRSKAGWFIGSIIIVLYSIFPIAWILSLSLKPPSDL